MNRFIKNILSGIGVGIANVIPGLSGGTILVLTNTFEPLTEAIAMSLKPHNEKRKSHLLLILEIVLGLIIGIATFSFLIPFLSKYIYAQMTLFFLGLVLASSFLFYKKEIKILKNVRFITLIIGFVICLLMSIFVVATGSIEPSFDTHIKISKLLLLLAMGSLAGAAMIFPGISGSLLLFMFGMYYEVWGYIKETIKQLLHFTFNGYIIIPTIFIGLGILLGIFLSSYISKIVLKKYRLGTLSLILGLVIGGCATLLPISKNIPQDVSVKWNAITIITSIFALVLGILTIYVFQKMALKKQVKAKEI